MSDSMEKRASYYISQVNHADYMNSVALRALKRKNLAFKKKYPKGIPSVGGSSSTGELKTLSRVKATPIQRTKYPALEGIGSRTAAASTKKYITPKAGHGLGGSAKRIQRTTATPLQRLRRLTASELTFLNLSSGRPMNYPRRAGTVRRPIRVRAMQVP